MRRGKLTLVNPGSGVMSLGRCQVFALASAFATFLPGCQDSSPPPPAAGMANGRLDVVVRCLYRKTVEYWGVAPSTATMFATWNQQRTRADMTVQASERTLAKYRVEQLLDSVRVEGGIVDPSVVIQSSADADAASNRSRQIVSPCLDEGGF